LGKPTNEEFFSYSKMTGYMTQRKRINFSLKDCLNEYLNAVHISFRARRRDANARWKSILHLHTKSFLQPFWFHCHQLEERKVESIANFE